MDLRDRPEDEAFRKEVRAWLDAHVVGEFAALGGRGGSGDETFGFETRLEWEQVLAADGWTCIGWPVEYGGRGASIAQQVIFNEEYVRARAPGRVSILGRGPPRPDHHPVRHPRAEGAVPPSDRGRHRALVPGLLRAQRRQRPGQRADQGRCSTATSGWSPARRCGPRWPTSPTGASWSAAPSRGRSATGASPTCWCPWTSPASRSGPSPSSPGPPSSTRSSSTVPAPRPTNVVGEVGDGWRVALATLAFERGVGLLGHQLSFRRELDHLVAVARANGAGLRPGGPPAPGPLLRRARDPPATTPCAACPATTGRWRRRRRRSASSTGPAGTSASASWPSTSWARPAWWLEGFPYELDEFQRTFLFSRSETIYGGSNEIQKNIIGERVLGLPPEPKGVSR